MGLENLAAKTACYIVQKGKGRQLASEGSQELYRFAQDVLKGEIFPLSSKVDVLRGYEINSQGFDQLDKEVVRPQVLVISNHHSEGQ